MKNFRRVLSLIVVLAMAMSMSAFAAVWQTNDVIESWTEDEYNDDSNWNGYDQSLSVQDAVTAAGTNAATVKVAEGDTLRATVNISADKDITIDLNGNDLTTSYSGSAIALNVQNGGSLTVTDNSEDADGSLRTGASYGIMVQSGGEATVSGGTVSAAKYGATVYSGGTVNVTGGTVSGTNDGVWAYGGEVNVSGEGTVSGTRGIRSSLAGSEINVSENGTVSGSTYGIYTTAGSTDIDISGGTVKGTGTSSYGIYSSGGDDIDISGGKVSGGFYAISTNKAQGATTIDISGDAEVAGRTTGTGGGAIISQASAIAKNTADNATAITISGDATLKGVNGINIYGGDSIEMTGGTLMTGQSYAISNNGSSGQADTTITIGGNAKIDSDGMAVYHAGSGTLNIEGNADISAAWGAIEIRAGELNMTGGKVVGDADGVWYSANGNGHAVYGAGIAVAQHTTKTDIDVNISGGSVTGPVAIYEANVQGNDAESIAKVNISITGGTFENASGAQSMAAYTERDGYVSAGEGEAVYSEDVNGFINGGVFNVILPAEYLAPGFFQLTEAVGSLVAGRIVTQAMVDAELARLAAEAEAMYSGADDAEDEETIEEEATPLAALPEGFDADLTVAEIVDAAVELGLVEDAEAFAPVAAATVDLVTTALTLAADDEEIDVTAIAEAAGIDLESEVSREQMVVALFTLAEIKGYDVSTRDELSNFVDSDEVSDFAEAAIQWAVSIGLLKGVSSDLLAPGTTLTQQQLILLLLRFVALTK